MANQHLVTTYLAGSERGRNTFFSPLQAISIRVHLVPSVVKKWSQSKSPKGPSLEPCIPDGRSRLETLQQPSIIKS